MAAQQDLAAAFRRQQDELRAEVVRDAVSVWNATFDPSSPDASFMEARRLLVALVRSRYPASVQTAMTFYPRIRALAGFDGPFQPVAAPEPAVEELNTVLGATGIAAYRIARRAGQGPQQAKNTAGVTVSGSTSRLVAGGGRETVHRSVEEDGQALGYQRVTDADPCSFCAMLASRGPVYKTERTAGARGSGRRYHDHDACSVAPVFSDSDRDWVARVESLSDQWVRATRGLSGDEARNAWRRYWESREE